MIIDTTCSVVERKMKDAPVPNQFTWNVGDFTVSMNNISFVSTNNIRSMNDPVIFDCKVVFKRDVVFSDSVIFHADQIGSAKLINWDTPKKPGSLTEYGYDDHPQYSFN